MTTERAGDDLTATRDDLLDRVLADRASLFERLARGPAGDEPQGQTSQH